MKLLGGTISEGVKVQGNQRSVTNLSKAVTPGGKYRLMFPIAAVEGGGYDILAATAPVRKLDFKKLGFATMPLEDFDVTDTGKIVDKSGLGGLARISRIMLEAECATEKAKAKEEAQKEADLQNNGVIDQVALAMKFEKIEEKYHGNKEKEGVFADVAPAIGGVNILIATECLLVPLDPARSYQPDWDKAQVVALELRSTKIGQIRTCLNNKANVDFEGGFLEVDYDYSGSTDKKVLGRIATFQTVAKDQWLKNTDPVAFETKGISALSRVSRTPEQIAAKNLSLSANVQAKEVADRYLKFLSKQALVINNIDFDKEETKKAAKDLFEYKVGASITGFTDKVKAAAMANGDNLDAVVTEDTESAVGAAEVLGATSIEQLAELADTVDEVTAEEFGSDL